MSARVRSLSRSRVKPGELPPAAVKHVAKKADGPVLLDPSFSTIGLVKKYYQSFVADSPLAFAWALTRPDGAVFRGRVPVFAEDAPGAKMSVYLVGALIQEMVWQRSGSSLALCGPPSMRHALAAAFSPGGQYDFEVAAMPVVNGTQGEPFEVTVVEEEAALPAARAPSGQERKANYYEMALKTCAGRAHAGTMSPAEEEGFFALYSEFFSSIRDGEDCAVAADADAEELQRLPPFGAAASGWAEVSLFYRRWTEFSTRKSFEDASEWKVGEAENRKLRREIEKQNAKLRDAAKKDFNSEVRRLVGYVQKRDPRWQEHAAAKARDDQEKSQRRRAERESQRAEEAQRRLERKDATRRAEEERWKEVSAVRQARREEGEAVSDESSEGDRRRRRRRRGQDREADAAGDARESSSDSDGGEEGAALPAEGAAPPAPCARRFSPPPRVGRDAAEHGSEDEGAEERGLARRGRARARAQAVEYRCEVCMMTFATDKLYDGHMKSKKHRAEVAFKRQMEELLAEEGADVQAGGASSAGAGASEGAAACVDAAGADAASGDEASAPCPDEGGGDEAAGAGAEAVRRPAFRVTIQDDRSEEEDDGRSRREKKARQKELQERASERARAPGDGEEGEEQGEEDEEDGLSHAERKRRKAAAKKELLEKGEGAAAKAKPKQRRELHCRRNAHGGGKVGGGCGGR